MQPPFGLLNGLVMFILSPRQLLWGRAGVLRGTYRAVKNRTHELSVLVALSADAMYLFSLAATFLFKG